MIESDDELEKLVQTAAALVQQDPRFAGLAPTVVARGLADMESRHAKLKGPDVRATLHAIYVGKKTVSAIANERGVGNSAVQWQLRQAGLLAEDVNVLSDLGDVEVPTETAAVGTSLVAKFERELTGIPVPVVQAALAQTPPAQVEIFRMLAEQDELGWRAYALTKNLNPTRFVAQADSMPASIAARIRATDPESYSAPDTGRKRDRKGQHRKVAKLPMSTVIAQTFRRRIEDGDEGYTPGSHLPPKAETAGEFGSSTKPVGQAYKELVESGHVESPRPPQPPKVIWQLSETKTKRNVPRP